MTLAIIFESVGVGEWFVLLAVVLIVVGPKRLPSTARKFGHYYSKFRRAAEGFKRQLLEMDTEITNAVNEAEAAAENEMKDVNEAFGSASSEDGASDSSFNPEEYGLPPEDYYSHPDEGAAVAEATPPATSAESEQAPASPAESSPKAEA